MATDTLSPPSTTSRAWPPLLLAATPASTASAEYLSFVFGDYMNVYVKHKFQTKEPRFAAMATSISRVSSTSLALVPHRV
jgi:hypothetical protein